ncbi:hypothetical protein K9M79_00035 [Candidatus Woesearchaeota archaeon]|nr:hypothetical protein [Candidatus Woesearchaeota archaeon]
MDPITKDFNEMVQKIGNPVGADSLVMSIYAILYLAPGPVAMEDLAKTTGYSLASVSSKTKMMETMGLIERRNTPGTRKLYYYMEKNLTEMFKNFFIKKEKTQVAVAKQMLPPIIKKYENEKLSDEDKIKLKNMKEYYKCILKFEKIIQEIVTMIDKQ